MKRDFTGYTADQLLQDDFFIDSVQNYTEETDLFWEIQVEEKVIEEKELAVARLFLHSLQVEKGEMSNRDLSILWEKIGDTNSQPQPRKKTIYFSRFFLAASISLLIGIGIFFSTKNKPAEESLRDIAQYIKSDAEATDVQLVLSNNERISINEEKVDILYNNDGDITVNTKKIGKEADVTSNKDMTVGKKINQLIVAKGKRSTLTFSDGTVLWVNAGSRVVYPEQFDAKQREIYVDGEAYLQVSPDKNRPFIVKTKNIDISVLGTSFNVTAYEEDDLQTVALVEGEVEIAMGKDKIARLTPDDLFRLEEGKTHVEKTDVSDYISWIDGWCIFYSEKLPVILDRLSRYYGKPIVYTSDIEQIKCSGKLELKDDLQTVLNALSETAPVQYKEDLGGFKMYTVNN